MRLSPESRAELLNELRLRRLFRDKVMCKRWGISQRTLARLQAEVLAEPMAQKMPDAVRIACFTTSDRKKTPETV